MAYGNCDTPSAAIREPEVQAALDRLARAAGSISDETGYYSERLASVLSVSPPVTEGLSKDGASSCDLAARINSVARQIESSAQAFGDLRRRIEL